MEKRFGALRVIGIIFKVLGVIVFLIALIAAVAALVGGAARMLGPGDWRFMMRGLGVLGSLWILLWGAISAVFLYGIGEVLDLLIAVEENTRATRLLLERERGNTP
ncbi:MAG: hypothetical protein ACPLUL_11680 [Thermanaerothrix sp.]|jgi:hypothetical protein|uniref:DUF4282 domain-containing protein n=1 Tax=Thermanaerothrix solaris TaxID=3058434 RepID=A0ABU3NQA0_9CHLR|nr:hypothetical protein [Thermanaerothrix sp. 4228-RoL]MDT8899018.1 hypothetical protein [Thermanaerothrix sp. 4228-RoL]